MDQIDAQKQVFLFVHGRRDLLDRSVSALVKNGFSKEKIIPAKPDQVGQVGDYMAMLWMPPNPDHIKIQKITKVNNVDSHGMIGLWKGVETQDLFTISL